MFSRSPILFHLRLIRPQNQPWSVALRFWTESTMAQSGYLSLSCLSLFTFCFFSSFRWTYISALEPQKLARSFALWSGQSGWLIRLSFVLHFSPFICLLKCCVYHIWNVFECVWVSSEWTGCSWPAHRHCKYNTLWTTSPVLSVQAVLKHGTLLSTEVSRKPLFVALLLEWRICGFVKKAYRRGQPNRKLLFSMNATVNVSLKNSSHNLQIVWEFEGERMKSSSRFSLDPPPPGPFAE